MLTRTARREHAKGVLDQILRRKIKSIRCRKFRRKYLDVVRRVQDASGLLAPSRYLPRGWDADYAKILDGLEGVADCFEWAIRTVEGWDEPAGPPLAGFASLVHHLFANYPVPPVLLSPWFEPTGHTARRYRWSFCRVGQGASLRAACLPIHLNRRMAHEFAQAPGSMSVEFAARWAQVRGLGGPDDLARAVAATRLGREFHHGVGFWEGLIRLFVQTPAADLGLVDGIVEYLYHRRFHRQAVRIGGGEGVEIHLQPAEPDLSLKGRTVASLARRAEAWRAEARPEDGGRAFMAWESTRIEEYFEADESDPDRAWTIRELLDSDALAAEGMSMHHCVATYAEPCARRESSIWSLGEETPHGRKRLLTIEVEPKTRQVVQASMRCNDDPDARCMALLRAWAGREGLGMAAFDPEPAEAEAGAGAEAAGVLEPAGAGA